MSTDRLYGAVVLPRLTDRSFLKAMQSEMNSLMYSMSADIHRQMFGSCRHYSSKERSRIFRRRPKEFRDKWWIVYKKLQEHERRKSLKASPWEGLSKCL